MGDRRIVLSTGFTIRFIASENYLFGPVGGAAKIAHYVGVDGRSDSTCGVGDPNLDCMGIFRGSTGDVGGNNVYLNGTQSHVEAATSPITLNTLSGPNHAAAVVLRYREWWTTNPSGQEDVLQIGTRSPSRGDQPPVNVLQNVVSSGINVGSPVGLHVHDNPSDMVSSLSIIPFFATQPFQTGVDVYMPATTPTDGTITFWNAPRGDTSRPQVLNTPNWASDGHRITIQLNDYVQDINSWGECKRAKPSPC